MVTSDYKIDATLHPHAYAKVGFETELTGDQAREFVAAADKSAAALSETYTGGFARDLAASDEAHEVTRLSALASDAGSKLDDLEAERDSLKQQTREAVLSGTAKYGVKSRLSAVDFELDRRREAEDILTPALDAARDQLEARRRQLAGEARQRATADLRVKREQLLDRLGQVAGPILAELLAVQKAEQSVLIDIPL
jgi:hypothetical protein